MSAGKEDNTPAQEPPAAPTDTSLDPQEQSETSEMPKDGANLSAGNSQIAGQENAQVPVEAEAVPQTQNTEGPPADAPPTVDPAEKREERIKAGIMPLFLTSVTQGMFKIRPEDFPLDAEETGSCFKMIPKADLLSDIQARLAISDFYPAKAPITDFPNEEILVYQDKEFKYGQNFFVVTTLDALDAILAPIVAENENQNSEDAIKASQNPSAKMWETLGSDKEIAMEAVVPNRELIIVQASKKLKEFGSQCKFGDRDAHDSFIECRPYRDSNYEVSRMEVSVAVQAIPELVGTKSQTTWNRPVNFCAQYQPLELDDAEKAKVMSSIDLNSFLKSVRGVFESVLLQNELVDIFADGYAQLGEEEIALLEQGTQVHLQEYQSFTDLKHSKDKSISCIAWHPALKGVLAVSCAHRATLDEKIEAGFTKNVSGGIQKSLILIWSFQDPIHPQLILEAPDDIHHFNFNPHDHNMIIGGCVTGQIVLWDISEYQDKLKMNRKTREGENSSGDDSNASGKSGGMRLDRQVGHVRWVAISSIEASHRGPVVDLTWMPEGVEVSLSGEITEIESKHRKQIITSSLDGSVFFWDLRGSRGSQGSEKELKELDLVWKPFLRVSLSSMDNTFDYGLFKTAIRAARKNSTDSMMIDKTLAAVTSKFYCSTEEGDIIVADWVGEKSNEEKAQASRVEHAYSRHFGTVNDLKRSPFFPDILLSVGGWSFHVWKEGFTAGPLLSSPPTKSYLVSGTWSPTRPGVFFISKFDGSIEIWDLMDQSHSPSSVQSVSSRAISAMEIHQTQTGVKSRTAPQFIAAGDDDGTLNILEAPRTLTKALKNEKAFIRAFFEREVKRVEYVKGRKELRAAERAQFDLNQASDMMAAAAAQAAKEDISRAVAPAPKKEDAPGGGGDEDAEKLEQDFLKMEKDFLELEVSH